MVPRSDWWTGRGNVERVEMRIATHPYVCVHGT